MNEILVRLGERSYSVWIEEGMLGQVGDRMLQLFRDARRAVVVGDRRVLARHGKALRASLWAARIEPVVFSVPPGETQKSLASVERLCGRLLEAGADRDTPLVAFGGGVVGDLAGFVAAVYMRGIPFVQVPTTLLAQVDASVGGKVAVNHARAKNLIGAFHQPAAVFVDPLVLRTLPARELRGGLAECVKCGVVRNLDAFQFLERNADALLRLDRFAVEETIAAAVSIKADIVERDERETRLRMLLNYGHTLGHAIEAATGYRRHRHGEAVAIGMTLAARIAVARRRMTAAQFDRQTALLLRLGLPVTHDLEPETLLKLARHDKKVRGGRLHFVLPRGLGHAVIESDVTDAEIRAALRAGRA